MNVADWAILAVLIVSVLVAASQGFFYEVFSLAGVVIGYLLAAWEYRAAAALFEPYVNSQSAANVAGFLTIFLAVVVLAGVAARLARWAISGVGLRWFDRLLGAAFGLARGVLLVTVFVMAFTAFAPGSQALANSSIAPYLLVIGRAASWLAPSQVRHQFRAGVEAVRAIREKDAGSKPAPSQSGARAGNQQQN